MRLVHQIASLALLGLSIGACTPPAQQAPPPAQTAAPAPPPAQSPAERGSYLVNAVGVCDDCHTPKKMTPTGPQLDTSRRLSGHPASDKIPPVPAGLLRPDGWLAIGNGHFTAWASPFGVSFARNLTPDTATGLGSWTETMFVNTIRNGKQQGEGRQLLPPMPWEVYRNMTDEDLKAIWAYLRTLPAVNNAVPDPIPPAGGPPGGAPPAKP